MSVVTASPGAIYRITLNRPDRLNAFNAQLSLSLVQALDDAARDPATRVVVLTGAGRGFSAGQDLGAPGVSPDGGEVMLGKILDDYYLPVIERVAQLRAPVVARVAGVAAGAGASLALACDIVVAAESAFFLQPFNRIGLLPDAGGTFFLPRSAGTARAMGMCLLGEKLSAVQAAQFGLIWQCVPDDELDATVERIAAQIAASPPLSMTAIKRAIRESSTRDLGQALRYERDVQDALGRSEDYAEGVRAFSQKRAPDFVGR
jgi:2-(1,2-epoxy-1,2-dihydrophenyl)acetyl-CoA isomerase